MPKRNFPFDGTSPLQLKTHINAFQFEKANDMDKVYGECTDCVASSSYAVFQFLNVVLASDTVCEKLKSDYSNEKPHLCTSSSAVRVSIVST